MATICAAIMALPLAAISAEPANVKELNPHWSVMGFYQRSIHRR
jgi:hypothetical protein